MLKPRWSVGGQAGPDGGDFRLVPTAGFSVAKNDSSSVTFATGESLAPDTSFNYVGFAGVTLSKPTVLPDKQHAIIPFGSRRWGLLIPRDRSGWDNPQFRPRQETLSRRPSSQ